MISPVVIATFIANLIIPIIYFIGKIIVGAIHLFWIVKGIL